MTPLSARELTKITQQINQIEAKYEAHFKMPFPKRIIGWWAPDNITDYPDELRRGVKQMARDVNRAILTNQPIKELSEKQWQKIIF